MRVIAITLLLLVLVPLPALAQFNMDPPRDPAGKPAAVQGDPAIALGLAWLAKTQDKKGYWDADDFGKQLGGKTDGPGKLANADLGVTGLAMLALLSDGHTHRRGRYKDRVKYGLRHLLRSQQANGRYGPAAGSYLINHAICAAAAAESYAQTKSPLVRGSVDKAIEFLMGARTAGGGWRYRSGSGESDLAVTVWAVLAMQIAKNSGRPVAGYDKANGELRKLLSSWTDAKTGAAGYKARGRGNEPGSERKHGVFDSSATHLKTHAPTAMAVVCQRLLGAPKQAWEPGAKLVALSLPHYGAAAEGKLSEADAIYSYFGALTVVPTGSDREGRWRKAQLDGLIASQSKDGVLAGSWAPVGAWGPAGGRVMTTALHVLTLSTWRNQLRAEAKAKAPPK